MNKIWNCNIIIPSHNPENVATFCEIKAEYTMVTVELIANFGKHVLK